MDTKVEASPASGDAPPAARPDDAPERGHARVRLAHEALLVSWARAELLIAADRDDLSRLRAVEEPAERWVERGRPDDLLIPSGLPLSDAKLLKRNFGDDLPADVAAFIEASEAADAVRAAAEERRQARERRLLVRLKRFGVAAAALALVALVGAGIAGWYWQVAERQTLAAQENAAEADRQRSLAERQRETAVAEKGRADEQARIAESQRERAETQAEIAARNADAAVSRLRQAQLAESLYLVRRANEAVDSRDVDSALNLVSLALPADPRREVAGDRPLTPDAVPTATRVLAALRAAPPDEIAIGDVTYGQPTFGAFDPVGATLFAAVDWRVRRWDAATGAEVPLRGALAAFEAEPDEATRSYPADDGRLVVAAGPDGRARIFEAGTGAPVADLAARVALPALAGAALSPDGARVALATGEDGAVEIWSGDLAARQRRIEAGCGAVADVAFAPDGASLAAACGDGTARVFDAASGAAGRIIQAGDAALRTVAFSRDGGRIAAGGDDTFAAIFDAGTGERLRRFEGHGAVVRRVAFFADGRRLLTASDDASGGIWNTATGTVDLVLTGHEGGIADIAIAGADESTLATASIDGTVWIWDSGSAQPTRTIRTPSGLPLAVAVSPDGTRLATGTDSGAIDLWDVRNATAPLLSMQHDGPVTALRFTPDGASLVSASGDGTARLWTVAEGDEIRSTGGALPGHWKSVVDAARTPDGRHVVTASEDWTARVWDAATGRETAVLRGQRHGVTALAVSPEGERVATAAVDGRVRLFRLDGTLDKTLGEGVKSFNDVTFSPDGLMVAAASDDDTAWLWNAETGEVIGQYVGHSSSVRNVAFSPDGALVLTASWDDTARLFDVVTGRPVQVLAGHRGDVNSAAFSRDGTLVVTTGDDGAARVWTVAPAREAEIETGQGGALRFVAFSPDGKRLVTASEDGTAAILDAADGTPLHILKGHSDAVFTAVFSPDGTKVATASRDGTARVWDAASGEPLATVEPSEEDVVYSAAFSPDGTRLVTASNAMTGTIATWDAATGASQSARDQPLGGTFAVFSPDGGRIVATTASEALVLDAETLDVLARLTGHGDTLLSAAFSPDGTEVLTASTDGTARIWNAASGRPLRTLRGHTAAVSSAIFSPDGSLAVTASEDGTTVVWDAARALPNATFREGEGKVFGASFSPDGTLVATATERSAVTVHALSSFGIAETAALLRAAIDAPLDPADRRALGLVSEEPARESESAVRRCDRLARDPFDPVPLAPADLPPDDPVDGDADARRLSRGVAFESLDAEAAVAACREAFAEAPDTRRIAYQFARALVAQRTGGAAADPADPAPAELLRAASRAGNAMGDYGLAVIADLSAPERLRYALAADAAGVPLAGRILSDLVMDPAGGPAPTPGGGVVPDAERPAASLAWLEKGARLGDPVALSSLARLHGRGPEEGGEAPALPRDLAAGFAEAALSVRVFEERGLALVPAAREAMRRRAFLARQLPPEAVARLWYAAADWSAGGELPR